MANEIPKDYVIPVGSGTGDIPDYSSFSQLSMVDRCPQQYEYRYVLGLVEPPAMALCQGDVFHDVIEVQHQHKIDTGKNLSTDDVQDAFADRWKKGRKIGFGRHQEPDWQPWKEVAKPDVVRDARRITLAANVTYHEAQAVRMKPLEVEAEYKLPFIDGKMFLAFIDCVHKVGRKKTDRSLVDNKLVGRRYEAGAGDSSMQLASYAWVHLIEHGSLPVEAAFHCTIKKNSPEVQVVPTKNLTQARVNGFLRWAELQLYIIQSGRFVGRVGPHCNWCGYAHRCPWKKGKGFGTVPAPKVARLTLGKTG